MDNLLCAVIDYDLTDFSIDNEKLIDELRQFLHKFIEKPIEIENPTWLKWDATIKFKYTSEDKIGFATFGHTGMVRIWEINKK